MIVVVALVLAGLDIQPLLKFAVAVVGGVPLCFVVAALVRKIPLLSRVL